MSELEAAFDRSPRERRPYSFSLGKFNQKVLRAYCERAGLVFLSILFTAVAPMLKMLPAHNRESITIASRTNPHHGPVEYLCHSHLQIINQGLQRKSDSPKFTQRSGQTGR